MTLICSHLYLPPKKKKTKQTKNLTQSAYYILSYVAIMRGKKWTLTPWQSKAAVWVWVPAFGHSQRHGSATKQKWCSCYHTFVDELNTSHKHECFDSPRLMHDLPQHSYGIVVAHVLKVDVIHLWGNKTEIWPDTTSVCVRFLSWTHLHPVLTCSSMSPGSIRPSAATAPPFIMEPM